MRHCLLENYIACVLLQFWWIFYSFYNITAVALEFDSMLRRLRNYRFVIIIYCSTR